MSENTMKNFPLIKQIFVKETENSFFYHIHNIIIEQVFKLLSDRGTLWQLALSFALYL